VKIILDHWSDRAVIGTNTGQDGRRKRPKPRMMCLTKHLYRSANFWHTTRSLDCPESAGSIIDTNREKQHDLPNHRGNIASLDPPHE
jgi:hypothetical protein